MVSSQVTAMTLMDASDVKLTIEVTESQIGNVAVGDEVTVTVPSMGAVKTGKISTVAPASDAETGTFPVDIAIVNSDGTLKPGMVVQVTLAN
jgi:multidrug efflux pump subunit AcrA (membrane-fusion protein)